MELRLYKLGLGLNKLVLLVLGKMGRQLCKQVLALNMMGLMELDMMELLLWLDKMELRLGKLGQMGQNKMEQMEPGKMGRQLYKQMLELNMMGLMELGKLEQMGLGMMVQLLYKLELGLGKLVLGLNKLGQQLELGILVLRLDKMVRLELDMLGQMGLGMLRLELYTMVLLLDMMELRLWLDNQHCHHNHRHFHHNHRHFLPFLFPYLYPSSCPYHHHRPYRRPFEHGQNCLITILKIQQILVSFLIPILILIFLNLFFVYIIYCFDFI